MTKRDPLDFTEDDLKALESAKVPDAIRRFTSRDKGSMAARARAYEKVALCARAERLALTEVRLLEATRMATGESPTSAIPARTNFEIENDLRVENGRLRRELDAKVAGHE